MSLHSVVVTACAAVLLVLAAGGHVQAGAAGGRAKGPQATNQHRRLGLSVYELRSPRQERSQTHHQQGAYARGVPAWTRRVQAAFNLANCGDILVLGVGGECFSCRVFCRRDSRLLVWFPHVYAWYVGHVLP